MGQSVQAKGSRVWAGDNLSFYIGTTETNFIYFPNLSRKRHPEIRIKSVQIRLNPLTKWDAFLHREFPTLHLNIPKNPSLFVGFLYLFSLQRKEKVHYSECNWKCNTDLCASTWLLGTGLRVCYNRPHLPIPLPTHSPPAERRKTSLLNRTHRK